MIDFQDLLDYNKFMQKLSELFYKTLGRTCFGSKSGYRMAYPESDPYFNAYVLVQQTDQCVEVWRGDIDMNSNESIQKLKELMLKIELPILIYRESTVHNRTFNGFPFPFEEYDCKIFVINNQPIMEKK